MAIEKIKCPILSEEISVEYDSEERICNVDCIYLNKKEVNQGVKGKTGWRILNCKETQGICRLISGAGIIPVRN